MTANSVFSTLNFPLRLRKSDVKLPICPSELRAIIKSHGWFDLRPYLTDERTFLRYAYDLPTGRGEFLVAAKGRFVEMTVFTGSARMAHTVAQRVLALNWPRETFHSQLRSHGNYSWIVEGMHGRFLRSASFYEDVFKIILTTNTIWARTKAMNDRATELWGRKARALMAFPTPSAILRAGETAMRAELRCGYRAPYLVELAQRAEAEPDVFLGEKAASYSPEEFYRLLRSIRGVGEVSAHYVARMYGFDLGFAVDSYVLRRCRELWGIPEKRLPGFLRRRYASVRPYASQLLWLEITQHWHSESEKSF